MTRSLGIGCAALGCLLMVVAGAARTARGAEAAKVVWQQGFEKDLGGAVPYYHGKKGEASKLEAVSDGAGEGGRFLRETLAGKRALEGFRLTATGLNGGRVATVSAKVRGKGRLMMALNAGGGWVYSRHFTLNGQWQRIEVSRTLRPQDQTMGIYFLSPQKIQPGGVFEVDDVRVTEAPPMQLKDAAVNGWRLDAADFAAASLVRKEGPAGDLVTGKRYSLDGIPFPGTSRPVTVYLHARGAGSTFRLQTRYAGVTQTLATVKGGNSADWQWVHFRPVSAQETGRSIRIESMGDKSGEASIDRIVLSTRKELDAAALNAARALFPAAPAALVAKTTRPPTIDGKADDDCWKQTVAIKDFVLFGSQTPASSATTARLAYDDQNLYVLLVCREPLLKTASQQQTDVIAKVTKRDGKVLTDDSCLIFLQPDETKPAAYEFTVNTIGTLLDAKTTRDHLWTDRDVSWNSSAKVAVQREDGYWVEELAIPLADLGVKSIQAGDQWGIGLDRIAQSRHELSAWQPTSLQGAHAPVALGAITFAEGAVALTPAEPLTRLSPGSNTLKATVDRSASFFTQVSGNQGADWQVDFDPKGGSLTHTFDVKQKGDVIARWGVLEPATLRPIYLSPAIHTGVQATNIALQLTTGGAYQIVVNDQVLSRGPSAKSRKIDIPLRQGVNVIAVRADAGRAAVSLQAPWMRHFDDAWRLNAASTPKATDSGLDDRKWALAKPDKAGVYGDSDQPIVLRRTILVGYTNVWPLPKPALYIAGNSAQQITFTALGLKGRMLDHWTTYLAVPKGLKVLGSTGYYGTTVDYQPTFNTQPAGEVSIDGQSLSLYKVTADKSMRANRHYRMSLFQVMVQIADASQAKPGESWKLHYWSAADDGTMIETPRTFEMRALAPLDGKMPKQFVFQLWGAFTSMDNESLRQATLRTMVAAGFNQIVAGNAWTTEAIKPYGLTQQMNVNFQPWSINVAPYLEKHPDEALIKADGQRSRQYMCMTLLLGKDWPVVSDVLAAKIKEIAPDVAQYDYEYGPFTGPHSCFCDRCLGAFRQYAKLGEDVKLTPAILKEKYKAQWEDFMAWRVAKMFALMKKTVHEAKPGTLFGAYSGYQSADTISRYGIDWRYIGQMKAIDVAGCGYGRSQERIDDTLKALDGIPVLFGRLLHPYQLSNLNAPTVASRAVILRRALDATGGVLVYERATMDGRSWEGVADVTRLVAQYEDLFVGRHALEAVGGQDPAAVTILKGKDVSLLCVMNNSAGSKKFQFKAPADLGGGKEFYTGEALTPGGEIQLTLQSGDARVYVLHP